MMNEEQSREKKLLYLDGIRELAAFAVVISHYIQVFYPAALNGKPQQSHFKWDIWYGHSPINLFFKAQTHYQCLTRKSSSEVDGIVLKKRQRSPLYPDFPLIIKSNQEIWVQQRSKE